MNTFKRVLCFLLFSCIKTYTASELVELMNTIVITVAAQTVNQEHKGSLGKNALFNIKEPVFAHNKIVGARTNYWLKNYVKTHRRLQQPRK